MGTKGHEKEEKLVGVFGMWEFAEGRRGIGTDRRFEFRHGDPAGQAPALRLS